MLPIDADLNIAQTAWGDSGVYFCSVISSQDVTGNSEDYTELLVLGKLIPFIATAFRYRYTLCRHFFILLSVSFPPPTILCLHIRIFENKCTKPLTDFSSGWKDRRVFITGWVLKGFLESQVAGNKSRPHKNNCGFIFLSQRESQILLTSCLALTYWLWKVVQASWYSSVKFQSHSRGVWTIRFNLKEQEGNNEVGVMSNSLQEYNWLVCFFKKHNHSWLILLEKIIWHMINSF